MDENLLTILYGFYVLGMTDANINLLQNDRAVTAMAAVGLTPEDVLVSVAQRRATFDQIIAERSDDFKSARLVRG